jgi:hypothetical protein
VTRAPACGVRSLHPSIHRSRRFSLTASIGGFFFHAIRVKPEDRIHVEPGKLGSTVAISQRRDAGIHTSHAPAIILRAMISGSNA